MQSYQLGYRVDTDGEPLANGLAYFYLTGTTTLKSVYSDSALGSALSNPVVADSAGFFPELVYLDTTATYRVVIKDETGTTISAYSADPINTSAGTGDIDGADISDGTVPSTALAPGAVVAHLGYTPANVAGDSFTGPVNVAGALTVTTAKTTTAAAAAGYASLNIPAGTAPTTPVAGDLWQESNVIKARLNGVSETLASLTALSSMTTTTSDFTGDGYIKIGPLYLQWGTVSVTSAASGTASDVAVTFPVAFPTGAIGCQITALQSSGGVSSTNMVPYFSALSASSVTIGMDANGGNATHTLYWLAYGN